MIFIFIQMEVACQIAIALSLDKVMALRNIVVQFVAILLTFIIGMEVVLRSVRLHSFNTLLQVKDGAYHHVLPTNLFILTILVKKLATGPWLRGVKLE